MHSVMALAKECIIIIIVKLSLCSELVRSISQDISIQIYSVASFNIFSESKPPTPVIDLFLRLSKKKLQHKRIITW